MSEHDHGGCSICASSCGDCNPPSNDVPSGADLGIDKGDNYDGSSCFPGDANVLTPSGAVKMQDLRVGDAVLSYTQDGRVASTAVTKRKVHRGTRLWRIVDSEGEIVEATGNHLFLTQRGWIQARCLVIGDRLSKVRADLTIKSAAIADIHRGRAVSAVYNLHTDAEFNFIVEGCIVHTFSHFRTLRVALQKFLNGLKRMIRGKSPPLFLPVST